MFRRDIYRLEGVGKPVDYDDLLPAEKGRSTLTAGPLAIYGPLRGRAMGSADYPGGLWFMVRGLTPGGTREFSPFYPRRRPYHGRPYKHVIVAARVNADGSAAEARWDPYDTATGWPDPEGVYACIIHDVDTGNKIGINFLIRYKRGLIATPRWYLRAIRGVITKSGLRLLGKIVPESVKSLVRDKLRR